MAGGGGGGVAKGSRGGFSRDLNALRLDASANDFALFGSEFYLFSAWLAQGGASGFCEGDVRVFPFRWMFGRLQ